MSLPLGPPTPLRTPRAACFKHCSPSSTIGAPFRPLQQLIACILLLPRLLVPGGFHECILEAHFERYITLTRVLELFRAPEWIFSIEVSAYDDDFAIFVADGCWVLVNFGLLVEVFV